MARINAYAADSPGGELKPFEYDPGTLGPTEVEIEVEYCGICHSDLSMLKNEWGMAAYPLVPGHEVAGVVREIGSAVTHLKPGQRVGLGWHAGYCMTCESCMSGDHNLCADATGTIVQHHGGFADRVRAQAAAAIPLPDKLDARYAGPLLCGGITVFNPLLQFDISPTSRVGVIGIGGLGHMALKFLNAWGCKVTAFTSSPAKEKEAREFGAHDVLDSRDPDALTAAARSLDMIISTVNVTLDWGAYIGTLRPKGRLHVVGAALEPMQIGAFSLIMNQISISGSPVGSPVALAKMLDFAAVHGIAPQTETFKFAQVNEAMKHLEEGKARYRIVLSH